MAVLTLQRAALPQIADRLADEVGVAARPLAEELRQLLGQLAPSVGFCERACVCTGQRLQLELHEQGLKRLRARSTSCQAG